MKLREGFLLIIYSVVSQIVDTIPTIYMHNSCYGQVLKGYISSSGFLVFDSDLLPAGNLYECTVYLKPEAVVTNAGVLFSFSMLDMTGGCNDTTLTVADGEKEEDIIFHTFVLGPNKPLCGSGLAFSKDTVFASKYDRLAIVFRRRTPVYRAKFNMTFLSYFEGPCDYYSSLFTCANERCIEKKFTCLNLNPCGDNSDCLPVETGKKSLTDKLLENIKNIIVVIACFVGVMFLYGVLKKFYSRQRRLGNLGNIPVIGCLTEHLFARSSDSSNLRVRTTAERRALSQRSSVEAGPDSSRSTPAYPGLHRGYSASSETNPGTPPPTYQEVARTVPPVPSQISLPPSYDEFMAHTDKYVKDP